MLADNFILSLSNLELDRKNYLPDCSGIYYVIDLDKTIWYIGRSVNINRRWNREKSHHRYEQLLSLALEQKTTFFLYYRRVNVKQINQEEKQAIFKYQPLLNNTPIDKTLVRSRQNPNLLLNSTLTILSDFTKSTNRKEFKQQALKNNFNMETKIKVEDRVEKDIQAIKTFRRKFISFKDDNIGLNIELEICIDSQSRLFVRHNNWDYLLGYQLNRFNLNNLSGVDNYILNLNSRLLSISNPFKWFGYKLNIDNILIIDEEDNFEIETLAIMLPLRMFINLLENVWIKNSGSSRVTMIIS
jgi:hypothetical protein